MHYTGMTFRPPYEANSLLLQVTTGCSHNACTFCVMYKDVPYCVSSWDEIDTDLREAGITFSLNIINAAAGPEHRFEHAAANAAFCNEVQPYLLFVSPLHVDPGSALERSFDQLGFEECSLGEYIEEEIAFLEGLELQDCVFFGMHVSNPVPVLGMLPRDKEELLRQLREGMAGIPEERLKSHPQKGAEGRLL